MVKKINKKLMLKNVMIKKKDNRQDTQEFTITEICKSGTKYLKKV